MEHRAESWRLEERLNDFGFWDADLKAKIQVFDKLRP
jgi:hypothetical protein